MPELVDVVIPVYNAPEFSRRCIESLYTHVSARIGRVVVHDDRSDPPTRDMLDQLRHAGLEVHHSPRNSGFGQSVNQAVARTSSELVLVLNSDVAVFDDFITPLVQALRDDAGVAAVSPSGSNFRRYNLDRYLRYRGCIVSYALWAYAFLIRKAVFEKIGGFDGAFGRGYFEDLDLSRRLIAQGWRFAVHPDARVDHGHHGSFTELEGTDELLEGNGRIYHERYPDSCQQVLLLSGDRSLETLPQELRRSMDQIMQRGGQLHWATPRGPARLSALQMRGRRLGPLSGPLRIWRQRKKPYRRFTELWCLRSGHGLASVPSRVMARVLGIPVRDWADESSHA